MLRRQGETSFHWHRGLGGLEGRGLVSSVSLVAGTKTRPTRRVSLRSGRTRRPTNGPFAITSAGHGLAL